MKNIEKYKEAILNNPQTDMTCCVKDLINYGECYEDCKDCKKHAMEWLLSEAPILDEVEKKYLSDVIRPFRKRVACIYKIREYDNYVYIKIYLSSIKGKGRKDIIALPSFEEGTMYKGMQVAKQYSLEELGL